MKKIAVALIIFIFMDKPWLIIFLFNQVGLLSISLIFEHNPSCARVDKFKDAVNELVFMTINYHLIYFTDFAEVHQQLWMGRSVIITLILYASSVTGLILLDEMVKFRRRLQMQWMVARRKAKIRKMAQEKLEQQKLEQKLSTPPVQNKRRHRRQKIVKNEDQQFVSSDVLVNGP